MSISDLMQAMLAAGAPMDAILIAVRAMEAKDAEIKELQQAEAEKKAAHAAWKRQRRAEIAVSMDSPRTDHGQSIPSPLPDKEKGTQKEINPPPHTHTRDALARRPEAWPCPVGVDATHWGDFLANRKRKRLVNTETARLGVMRDLEQNSDDHWPPGRLVEHAAAKGWGSINYPEEGPRNARSANHRNGTPATGHGRTIDAGFAFIADGEPDRSDPRFPH